MGLLERDGIDGLTTNAVAASAGVSIGTLYQFFPNKEAILDTLADREIADMASRVMQVMQDPAIATTEARVAAIVSAVVTSYGARHRAHRLVMAHSLARGGGKLSPLLSNLIAHLSSQRQVGPITRQLGSTDAFVLAHGFAGVLRAMIVEAENAPPQNDLEQALSRWVISFVQ